jgi:hypothetical protein
MAARPNWAVDPLQFPGRRVSGICSRPRCCDAYLSPPKRGSNYPGLDGPTAAGLSDITTANPTTLLRLPPPPAFLWQYIGLTPLAVPVGDAPAEAKNALEAQVVAGWQPFVERGETVVRQPMVLATMSKTPAWRPLHTMYAQMTVEAEAQTIASWAKAHPDEVVIADFDHVCPNNAKDGTGGLIETLQAPDPVTGRACAMSPSGSALGLTCRLCHPRP